MSTTTQQRGPTASHPDLNGRLRLDAAGSRLRQPRTSWVALGLLVLVGFGLFGAITVARVASREPVLAIAQPLPRGETLTAAHVKVVNVGTDGDVEVVSSADLTSMIGLTAVTDLDVGTLLTTSQFSTGPSIAPGQSVVGLALQPGEYPTSTLRPGDVLVVVRTPPANVSADVEVEPVVLVDRAEVFAIEQLSDSAQTYMISLTVPEGTVPDISAAAASGRIRLALVGGQ